MKTMEWLTRQRRDRRRLGDELDAIGGEGGNATLTSKTAAESVGDISTWSGIASALTPSPQLILNVSSFFSLAATRRELGGCQPWCSIWTCNQHEECGGCGPCALPPPPPPLSPQRFNTNPFISQAGWYVHPTLRSNLIDRTLPLAESGAERAALRQMADTPSAFWVDTRAKVRGTTLDTLEGILLNSSHGTRQLCVFVLCKRRAPPTRAVSLPSSSSPPPPPPSPLDLSTSDCECPLLHPPLLAPPTHRQPAQPRLQRQGEQWRDLLQWRKCRGLLAHSKRAHMRQHPRPLLR